MISSCGDQELLEGYCSWGLDEGGLVESALGPVVKCERILNNDDQTFIMSFIMCRWEEWERREFPLWTHFFLM